MATELKLFTGRGPTLDGLTNGLQEFISAQLAKYPEITILSAAPTSLFDGTNYALTVAVVLHIPDDAPPTVVEEVRRLGYHVPSPTSSRDRIR